MGDVELSRSGDVIRRLPGGAVQLVRPVSPNIEPPSWSSLLRCDHGAVLRECAMCARFEDGAAEAIYERALARWREAEDG